MKKIAVIGATGSIGRQAVEIIDTHSDDFTLALVSANSNAEKLAEIANAHKVPTVCYTGADGEKLSGLLDYPCKLYCGKDALERGAENADYDVFLNSVLGIAALKPTLIAMKRGARIALSNKEMLVCAGDLVMEYAAACNAEILPVDSEHSAIFQCLQSGSHAEIDELIITSSGGAFRDLPLDKLPEVTPEDALRHPSWNMGAKITVDCATMVNKSFEIIEAHHLFDVPYKKISAVIHKQSVIHSMVRFCDGCVMAQMGVPDMRLPIQYAFTYPERKVSLAAKLPLDGALTFETVDNNRYPCFVLGLDCAKNGGTFPAAFMCADSVIVPLFLGGRISYLQIYDLLEKATRKFGRTGKYTFDDVFYINDEVKRYILTVVGE